MPAIHMNPEDHRSRVGVEKRERMRLRLIESALQVFATKGSDVPVIEDVTAIAHVSRGTFYNYFRTNEELLDAVVNCLEHELIDLIELAIGTIADPAQRVANGVRLVLKTTHEHHLLAKFATRVRIDRSSQPHVGVERLIRDIQSGIAQGRFDISDARIGLSLVLGATQSAIYALNKGARLPTGFEDEIAFHVLLGLGVPKHDAKSLASEPIEPLRLTTASLLERTKHVQVP